MVEQTPVFIHPSSALFQRQPDWVLYYELVLTSKEYMREVCAIDPKWLVEFAPRFFRCAAAPCGVWKMNLHPARALAAMPAW